MKGRAIQVGGTAWIWEPSFDSEVMDYEVTSNNKKEAGEVGGLIGKRKKTDSGNNLSDKNQ